MKKMLMIASVPSMIGQFNMQNIQILQRLEYQVDVACDWNDRSVWDDGKIENLRIRLKSMNIRMFQIDFSRSVLRFDRHITAYNQLAELLKMQRYDFMHCHSPIGGAISRLACKKTDTKCIYTAHGFHFYKGAPLLNWLIYYSIEKWLSRYTNILITINKEDFNRAQRKFKMKQLEYVSGVGVDIKQFQLENFDRKEYREKLGYTDEDFVILSVGELNKNKNHEVVLRTIAKLNNPKVKYMIAGQGVLKDYLLNLAEKLHIKNQIQLLGFRKDIPELLNSSDLYVLPSLREGLNVSLMEAIASRIPCVASNIRGNMDLACYGVCLFSSLDDIKSSIQNYMDNKQVSVIKKTDFEFSREKMQKIMYGIYKNI